MAIIVKGEITITKGFDHWKSMVFSQEEKMAEEHGFIDISECESRPSIGDIVRVVPNHVCVVVNMFDQLVAVRDNNIVDVIPVEARGRLV